MNEITITRTYSFWRHPIKWWKDRKKFAFMNIMANQMWKNGMKEEVEKMQLDMLMYGSAVMKDGERIDLTTL